MKVTAVFEKTGEIADGYVPVMPRDRYRFAEAYRLIGAQLFDLLISDGLTLFEVKVLSTIALTIKRGNHLQLVQKDIALRLKADKADVSKAVRRLESLNLLRRDTRLGNRKAAIVNPMLLFNGSASEHGAAIEEWEAMGAIAKGNDASVSERATIARRSRAEGPVMSNRRRKSHAA